MSPYGNWINYPSYGYAWVPRVSSGFQPYATNGHWIYTDYGWTWVSDYSWGWAPFHYGRWLYDNSYGWVWLPGSEWGPAWVAWRQTPDYYGWAPLGPGMSISVGINIPAVRWIFAPRRYISSRYLPRYYVRRQQNITIINNSTIINNRVVYNKNVYAGGPPHRDVERATGAPVRRVRVTNTSRPTTGRVSNDQLHIFRPAVNSSSRSSAAPKRVIPAKSGAAPAHGNSNAPARRVTPPSGNHAPARTVAPGRSPAERNTAPARGEAPARRTVPSQNREHAPAAPQHAPAAPQRKSAAPQARPAPSRTVPHSSPAPERAAPARQTSVHRAAPASRVSASSRPQRRVAPSRSSRPAPHVARSTVQRSTPRKSSSSAHSAPSRRVVQR
ncbi:hypothetical protein GCM10023143_04560 [Compostibacter hankyongensis]|uniref:DUF3300 domain-containing protein n=1 Tax=Compostibacter hankyongensis TaxID=1007089 RepID=A0ABP8FEZ6_9BACT